MRRSAEEIAKMRKAGKDRRRDARGHSRGCGPRCYHARPGQARPRGHRAEGGRSNFLNYRGFPATICTSPNDMIVHGIPGDYVLKDGDILSIDCGAIVEGYHGDAAFTMPIGEVIPEAARLLEVTEASLWAGIAELRRAAGCTTWAGRYRMWRKAPASPSFGSTWATGSALRCTRTPPSLTTGPAPRGLF